MCPQDDNESSTVTMAVRPALIIGATGQDGSLMARQLLDAGIAVHGTGRHVGLGEHPPAWHALGLTDSIVAHRLDPLDSAAVFQLVCDVQPSMIFCLAGQSSVGRSFAIPEETLRSHVEPLRHIAYAVRSLALDCHILLAASAEVFGETHPDHPACEEHPFRPRNPYGFAKQQAVEAARNFREQWGLKMSIAYLYNHESPWRDPAFLFGRLRQGIAALKAGGSEPIALGNGEIYRDWGWAPDYAAAMIQIAQLPQAQELILATGSTVRLRDAVSAVILAAGLDPDRDVTWNNAAQRRSGEALTMAANPAKARAMIGWSGSTSFPALAELLISDDGIATCR